MEESIENLIKQLDQLTQSKGSDKDFITLLQQLEQKANQIEEDDFDQFAYCKYIVANFYLINQIQLNPNQLKKYQNYHKNYSSQYAQYKKRQEEEEKQRQQQQEQNGKNNSKHDYNMVNIEEQMKMDQENNGEDGDDDEANFEEEKEEIIENLNGIDDSNNLNSNCEEEEEKQQLIELTNSIILNAEDLDKENIVNLQSKEENIVNLQTKEENTVNLQSKEGEKYEKKILMEKETKTKEYQYEDIMKSIYASQKLFLVYGNTGVGKSSFVKKIIMDDSIEVGGGEASVTQECKLYKKDQLQLIDCPGVNDTKRNRYEVLLIIAQYLYKNKINTKNIFLITVTNSNLKIEENLIQEISQAIFLVDIFDGNITIEDLQKFIPEITQSQNMLNWLDLNLHTKIDDNQKRKLIFAQRKKALSYLYHFINYHIVVTTHFDKIQYEDELQKVNRLKTECFKEQIWSNHSENFNFLKYDEHMKDQEKQLFLKIEKIIQIQKVNQTYRQGFSVQNILLIGKSQVGKSSIIEQIIKLKGLRGNGQQSKTQFCQMYSLFHGNIQYRFIDTPGYQGTDKNQTSFQNFKVIAEYLQRNQIKEFKLLVVKDPNDQRDTLDKVLEEMEFFIQNYFDQDSSLVDSLHLQQLFNLQSQKQRESGDSQVYLFDQFKHKLLQIERVRTGYPFDNEKLNDHNIQPFCFQTDRYHNEIYEEVDKDVSTKQKFSLFSRINRLKNNSVDDKIIYKIKQVSKVKMIENSKQYIDEYNKLKCLYLKKINLQKQLISSENDSNMLQKLKSDIFQIVVELNDSLFTVLENVIKSKEIQDFIKQQSFEQQQIIDEMNVNNIQANHNSPNSNDQNNQNQINQYIYNDIQRHILVINYKPILFELNESPNNIFITKKQTYYSQYAHQLREFIQKGNPEHQQLLEDLAKFRIIQELALQQYIQNQRIESWYDRNVEDILIHLDILVSGINKIIGSGVQIYRYITYFSEFAEQSALVYNSVKGANVAAMMFNTIFAVISIGIDFFSYKSGFISGVELGVSATANAVSGALSLGALLVPGVGWIVGGVAGGIALAGYGFTSIFFVSRKTLDTSSSVFFKNMIDDTSQNQQLSYFQQADFLKQNYNCTDYSQLTQKIGYDMLRHLKTKNYENDPQQRKFLLELFEIQEIDIKLQDKIAQYISQSYISNQFQVQFFTNNSDDNLASLHKIQNQLKQNSDLMENFFNQYTSQIDFGKIMSVYLKFQDIIKKKSKQQLEQKMYLIINWEREEKEITNTYIQLMQEFGSINKAYLRKKLSVNFEQSQTDLNKLDYLDGLTKTLDENQLVIYQFYEDLLPKIKVSSIMRSFEQLWAIIQIKTNLTNQHKNIDNIVCWNDQEQSVREAYVNKIAEFKFVQISLLSRHIQEQFNQEEKEDNIDFLEDILSYLQQNQQVIVLLNNQSLNVNLSKLYQLYNKFEEFIKQKLKSERALRSSGQIKWSQQEQEIITQYKEEVSKFSQITQEVILLLTHKSFKFDNLSNINYLAKIESHVKEQQESIYSFYNNLEHETIQTNIQKYKMEFEQIIQKRIKIYEIQKSESLGKEDNQQNQNEPIIWTKYQNEVFSNYIEEVTKFKDSLRNKCYLYTIQTEFGKGFLRKTDRFPILFYTYCNLMEQKGKYLYNQPLISDLTQDQANLRLKIRPENNFNNNFFNYQDENKLIQLLNLLALSDKYISNRYLQKIKGSKEFNLTYISSEEQLSCKPDFSFDLHHFAKRADTFEKFRLELIEKTQGKLKHTDHDQQERLKQFYDAQKELEHIFKHTNQQSQ